MRKLRKQTNGEVTVKFWVSFAAAIMGSTFVFASASAQEYPTKPIRIIVANSPGGTSDIFIRALADEFQRRAGQPMIIENRSGGGMNIAGKACAESPNDGYTVCLLPTDTLTLNQFTYKTISYRPEKDFDPITNLFMNPQVLVVSSQLGVSSLSELAEYSRRNPKTLNYSALSIPMQITMESWRRKSGADIVYVPSRGGGDIVAGLLAGTTPVAIVGLPNFISYIREKAVVALAVDSKERSGLFPDIPTLKELGFPEVPHVYFGLVAPTGVPQHVIQKLYSEINEIGNDPTFRQKRITDLGLVPVFDTPGAFAEFLKSHREKSRILIQDANFEPR